MSTPTTPHLSDSQIEQFREKIQKVQTLQEEVKEKQQSVQTTIAKIEAEKEMLEKQRDTLLQTLKEQFGVENEEQAIQKMEEISKQLDSLILEYSNYLNNIDDILSQKKEILDFYKNN